MATKRALVHYSGALGELLVADSLLGNIATADAWATGRTISTTGDATGTSAAWTGSANISFALTIANDVVSNAKLANMATKTYKGRTTAATGDPEDVAVATLKADLAYGTAADKNTGTSGNAVPLLDAANTWSLGQTFSADLIRDGAAGVARSIRYTTSGVLRWLISANAAAESGANAGSNLTFNSYDDAGVLIEATGAINRASGNWNLKSLTLNIKLAIAEGGTGAATAAAARVNLGMDQQTITFVIDGGGAAITIGIKGDLEIPYACTINRVTMMADQSGSIVVDIWKDTYANYPPIDADSITAAAVPTITTALKSQDATLTGWTTAVAAGDILRFNVDSITSIQRVTISLRVTR